MSAYIVENETISKIIDALGEATSSFYRFPTPPQSLQVNTRAEAIVLGQRMLDMNTHSVNERYAVNHGAVESPIFVYKSLPAHSALEVYKALRCFLYQSCEGNTPQVNPLFNELETFAKDLAEHIVMALPQWQDAKWG
jgi:hypothetical protein